MTAENPAARDEVAEGLRAKVEAALGSQYRIVRLLGQGGMGAVFLAREEALDRLVAVKVLPPGKGDGEARERFRREARLAAQLSHPNIVPLLGFGDIATTLYLVMGYVSGESLGARLKRDGRLNPDETRRILADVAEALDYAHRRGVVHRDIKPDNILLDDETGRALLADFGIARGMTEEDALTRVGDVIGTPQYMSPEQAQGATVDGRSDLYSLGVVAFAMLTGRPPFQGGTPQETVLRRLTTDAPALRSVAPAVPPELASVIDRCLLRDRDARFPDARTFRLAVAPASLDDEQLPEPLDVLDGAGVTLALGMMVALAVTFYSVVPAYELLLHHRSHGSGSVWDLLDWFFHPPTLIPLGLWSLLALRLQLPLAAARSARSRGFSWPDIRFAFLRQPRGWPCLWYPRRYRRKDDVWARLPLSFRRARTLATVAVTAGVLLFSLLLSLDPLSVVVEGALTAFPEGWKRESAAGSAVQFVESVFAWSFLASAATLGITLVGSALAAFSGVRALRRQALDKFLEHRASRALLFGPTADRSVWKQPGLASLLLRPAGAAADRPLSPADYPGAMAHRASARTGDTRKVADAAVEIARRLVSEIAHIDHQLPRLEREADLKEAERIDQRLGALDAPESEDQSLMKELLQKQREILRRAASRLDEARGNRARAVDRLNSLWAGTESLGHGGQRASARLQVLLREVKADLKTSEADDLVEAPTLPRA